MVTNSIAQIIVATALIHSPVLPDESFEDIMCLTEAIYFEARDQDLTGMAAVALVTKNRVERQYRGATYCEVIQAPYQYSYRNSVIPAVYIPNRDVPDADALWWSVRLAVDVMNGDIPDFTMGSLHYFNPDKADPSWKHEATMKTTIGDHKFLVGVR